MAKGKRKQGTPLQAQKAENRRICRLLNAYLPPHQACLSRYFLAQFQHALPPRKQG